MRDKSKQIKSLYEKDPKAFTIECFNILTMFYIHLGHKSEAQIVNNLTKIFVEDLTTRYFTLELEQVKFAIEKGIKDNDPPIFVNVPTWNKFLRDYKTTEQGRRANNQIELYTIYQKRVKSFENLLDKREIKKIGK